MRATRYRSYLGTPAPPTLVRARRRHVLPR